MLDTSVFLSAKEKTSQTDLKVVKDLLLKARGLENKMKAYESELEKTMKEYVKLMEDEIPSLMMQCGLDKFGSSDLGVDVVVENQVFAKIPERFSNDAFEWLEKNNYSDIIKSVVQVDFGKGEIDKAKHIMDIAKEENLIADCKRVVHSQTLKSFVKSLLEEGVDFPMEFFGVFQKTVAKIKIRK